MKDLPLPPRELAAKAAAANRHFLYVDELRTAALPSNGDSFMIGKALYVFMVDDGTPEDGVSSIAPVALPLGMPNARYRRVTVRFPFLKS